MDELQRCWLILKRRKLPVAAVFGSVLALTALMTFSKQPVYEARGMLLLKRSSTTNTLTELSGKVSQLDAVGGSPLNTQAEIIRSTPIAEETIAVLNLQGVDPRSFLGSLNVTNIPGTDILEVAYRGGDPNHVAKIVNTLMEVYKRSDVESNRAEAKSARLFIEQQLPKVETAVQQAELALRRFREQNQVIDLSAEAQSAVSTISSTDQQLSTTRAELARVNAKTAALRRLLGSSPSTAFALSSPSAQQVLTELQQVEQKLALERTRFQENAVQIEDLKERQTALRSLLQQRMTQSISQQPNITKQLQAGQTQQSVIEQFVQSEVDRYGLVNQVSALSRIKTTYRQRASNLPRLEQQQRELERQRKAAQSTYEALLGKLQEIRVTENQNVGNVQIKAPALVSDRPVAPNRTMDLLKGGLLATLLAAAVAVVLEAIDKSIKTAEEARGLAGYPLLGIIPHFQPSTKMFSFSNGNGEQRLVPEVIVNSAPGSPISEAFRMLQTNLKFLTSDKPLKVFVVTSSVPKEGKSTVTANLAVATAQMDRRVLLIDADMRYPSQYHIWQVPNAVGLSNVLTGQAELQTAIHSVAPGLDLLTSGMSPPNPVALLDSHRMAALIETCSRIYDCVIIDSPPLRVAADASILGKMTDGILLLVRPGVSDSFNFTSSKQLLDQSSQNVLGLVVNGVISESEPYVYYYGYYGNGNGNGQKQPVSARSTRPRSDQS